MAQPHAGPRARLRDEPVPVTEAPPPIADPGAYARAVDAPEVIEALRRFYRYGEGRFPDRSPPRVPTWGGAQMRMHAAIRPLLDEIEGLRERLAERDGR